MGCTLFQMTMVTLATLGVLASGCGKNNNAGGTCSAPVTTTYPSTSAAPTLTFYYGSTSDTTGTALNSGNSSTYASYIKNGGAGPFGVWESGNGGEVAAEIEIRMNTRLGIFAMADGVVAYVQPSTAPLESGEVEGVWIRYGSNYVIKYVHVLNPVVSAGQQITAGQKLGDMVGYMNGGMEYFWEAELQRKSGTSISSVWWSSSTLLSNATAFNSLFVAPYVSAGGWTTNGSTSTTVSNWKSDANTSGEIDSTQRSQPCAFN